LESANPKLVEFIRETILRDGPVTFAWFMEQALYHPAHGYYSSGRSAIGRRGDYFTNVSVGLLFGRMLAFQFREMWETLGRPAAFTIVEQGAHSGEFAADVLTAAHGEMPEFAGALRYRIVEPFAVLRSRQSERLGSFAEQVTWSESLENLEPFCGVHFSNELLDALPVHLIRRANGGDWHERYVAFDRGELAFVDGALSSPRLRDAVSALPPLPADYETEISFAAADLVAAAAAKLSRGYILAVDYGHSRAEYYAPERSTGTVRCYAQHRVVESPLSHLGCADITAHVEWTSIADSAVSAGLRVDGFTDQHHFLTGILSAFPAAITGDEKARRALQTLLHPALLGSTFKVLCVSRDAPADTTLSGFKFARPMLKNGVAGADIR
jgi:SAM-dependent MidA family methyltransferase